MRDVIHYQCESCGHIFENDSAIEECNDCHTEICYAVE